MSIFDSATPFQKKLFYTATGLMLLHFFSIVMTGVADTLHSDILLGAVPDNYLR